MLELSRQGVERQLDEARFLSGRITRFKPVEFEELLEGADAIRLVDLQRPL